MDSRLLDTLRNAPSLDLYELNLMVNQLLADPIRILEIRRHLHLGAPVMFFDHRTNALMPGRVTELRQKDVCVQEDGVHRRRWILPYAAIVVESIARAAQQRHFIGKNSHAASTVIVSTSAIFVLRYWMVSVSSL